MHRTHKSPLKSGSGLEMVRRKPSHSVTRREWIGGAAAVGAMAALGSKSAATFFSEAPALVVGAAKRIFTPSPLLPVSGGMGPTRPTREKKGELTARALYLRKGDTAV